MEETLEKQNRPGTNLKGHVIKTGYTIKLVFSDGKISENGEMYLYMEDEDATVSGNVSLFVCS